MDSRVAKYYEKSGFKCFEKFYLLDRIFPPEKPVKREHEKAYELLAYALKNQDYFVFMDAGDVLFQLGFHDWASHVHKVSSTMKKHNLKKANIRKVK